MTCVEMNFTDIRSSDTSTARVYSCSASINSDETFIPRGI